MRKTKRAGMVGLFVAVVFAATLVIGVGVALADPPPVADADAGGPGFLCPAVGKGVLNHRPDAGVLPNGNYTFLPGHNQAGLHVPDKMPPLNTQGPGDSPGPGNGNSDWSPIWPNLVP